MKWRSFASILFVSLFAVALQSCVQDAQAKTVSEIDRFFEEYGQDDANTVLNLGGFALNLAVGDKDAKFESLRLLSIEKDQVPAKKKIDELKQSLNKRPMELLGSIKEDGQLIEFFGIEEDGYFTNLVATIYGKEKFVLAQVKGHFSKESLQKIDVDIEGLEFREDIL